MKDLQEALHILSFWESLVITITPDQSTYVQKIAIKNSTWECNTTKTPYVYGQILDQTDVTKEWKRKEGNEKHSIEKQSEVFHNASQGTSPDISYAAGAKLQTIIQNFIGMQ